ncbi:hypothetical protein GCM10008967_02540 [Bacillus carboniphilus]|uniref:SnoaL-like domain-containing protein n=1 Tax=Bacillus carboniphilus TaxID=86663 RepID=A0ABN0VRH6_9BACI
MLYLSHSALTEFTEMHDSFFEVWKQVMNSGDTSVVERFCEDYYVTFFMGTEQKPKFFNREESVEGMKQSVHSLLGATKRFENRVIRLRNENNGVVFYELVLEKEGIELARLFTIENWKRIGDQWLLSREIAESI